MDVLGDYGRTATVGRHRQRDVCVLVGFLSLKLDILLNLRDEDTHARILQQPTD